MKYVYYNDTIVGEVGVVEEDGYIIEVLVNEKIKDAEIKLTNLIQETFDQLDDYFKGKRKEFDIKIKLKGTSFQQKVWEELVRIPYGSTLSYKDIATKIGNMKASRAVGRANNKNPIPIIVPCHRVIGKNGKLVGYAMGLEIKQMLLDLENKYK
ncbi:TPA: methylated-DNA--[protein]-cysteine S-methyltransferase [bacterium]|nr:methylated-DNA--[protein]-cysteine S-methyltransferase [bacterium]